ncbi:QcrA and Rieske domain-containing protein [Actinomarinicola tropica]|uniref:Cytochrome bc1 complex Rieske iron-sulfur subunit n=1 Tax=Actinomarinicola tropica TaxID=2789776 RepID=A0A5Q2RQI9_9ACTN|nr:Rieske (2Fe-2S) protein [Actinomarinicola tropica]QGG96706.1 Rieske 2Fe-2S domain-containing protein [Actinomarinicola tropica]
MSYRETDTDPPADPVWRQDFPVTAAGEDEVTRREFVRYLVLASGGFALGNVGVAIWSSMREVAPGEPRPIVALDQLPENSAHIFEFPTSADPAILLHLPGGELRAFSQKCTHLGCVVYYEPEAVELECPCHEGFFEATTGEVISGPPQRPLGQIEIEVRDGVVWAVRNLGEAGHA